jgi:hypothetical protein
MGGRTNVHDEQRSCWSSVVSHDLVQSVDQKISERWHFTISELHLKGKYSLLCFYYSCWFVKSSSPVLFWYDCTISFSMLAMLFWSEDGGTCFLQNVGTYLPDNMASHTRRW